MFSFQFALALVAIVLARASLCDLDRGTNTQRIISANFTSLDRHHFRDLLSRMSLPRLVLAKPLSRALTVPEFGPKHMVLIQNRKTNSHARPGALVVDMQDIIISLGAQYL